MLGKKLANKANRILCTQRTLFLHHISPSNCVFSNCPATWAQKQLCFYSFPQKRLGQKGENNLVSFCQNSGVVGLCREAPTVESSHSPELFRVTSRGMFHTLPKYLSWQQQKTFRDLSPGTIASVSQLQFSRFCVSALTSTSYQRTYHTCTSTWENHAKEFTQQYSNVGRAPILMIKYKLLKNSKTLHKHITLRIYTAYLTKNLGPINLSLRPAPKRIR